MKDTLDATASTNMRCLPRDQKPANWERIKGWHFTHTKIDWRQWLFGVEWWAPDAGWYRSLFISVYVGPLRVRWRLNYRARRAPTEKGAECERCGGIGAVWGAEGTLDVVPCPDCGSEREPEGDEKGVSSDAREGVHRGLVGQPDEETEGDVAELKLFCEHGKWLHLECRECGRGPSPSSGEILSEKEFDAAIAEFANALEVGLPRKIYPIEEALRDAYRALREKLAEAERRNEGYEERWKEAVAEYEEESRKWGEFRRRLRSALWQDRFWPSNPGVGNHEIAAAVERAMHQLSEARVENERLRGILENAETTWLHEALTGVLVCDGRGCPYQDGSHSPSCPASWREDVEHKVAARIREALNP